MAKCQYMVMCKLLTCGIILILSCFLQSPYVCPVLVFLLWVLCLLYLNKIYKIYKNNISVT